jgi:hypothetical protein
MRRVFVRFNRSESFVHSRSSVGFTIITSGFEFSVHTANFRCRRHIDDGDCDEPDRPDERVAGSSREQDQSNESRDADEARSASGVPTGQGVCTENLIQVDAVMESPKLAE